MRLAVAALLCGRVPLQAHPRASLVSYHSREEGEEEGEGEWLIRSRSINGSKTSLPLKVTQGNRP